MQTKGQLMKSLNAAFSFAPPSILSLTILMFLLYHNDTIMKNEKIVHGLYAKNNKKVYLERQLAYAIMAVAKKEIIKSKQHTPFLLPDWVRQRSYYIIYSNFLGRRRIKYKRLMQSRRQSGISGTDALIALEIVNATVLSYIYFFTIFSITFHLCSISETSLNCVLARSKFCPGL